MTPSSSTLTAHDHVPRGVRGGCRAGQAAAGTGDRASRVTRHAHLVHRALTGANLAPVGGVDPGPDWIAERPGGGRRCTCGSSARTASPPARWTGSSRSPAPPSSSCSGCSNGDGEPAPLGICGQRLSPARHPVRRSAGRCRSARVVQRRVRVVAGPARAHPVGGRRSAVPFGVVAIQIKNNENIIEKTEKQMQDENAKHKPKTKIE